MTENGMPRKHSDPWLDLLRPYITGAAQALRGEGVQLEQSWLDPSGPRDATVLFRLADEAHALVWDEEAGWRTGRYESGRQGERTKLLNPVHLGGGVLVDPREMVERLLTGVTEPRHQVRAHTDVRDGLDDALALMRMG